MSSIFGAKRQADGIIAEIARDVGEITPEQAQAAADALTRSGAKSWPSLPKMIAALNAAKAPSAILSMGSGRYAQRLVDAEHARLEWSAPVLAKADVLIQSPMGAQAAAEHWIVGLWDFCRKNGRLPDAHEAPGVKRRSLNSRQKIMAGGKAMPGVVANYLERVQRLTDLAKEPV